MREPTCCQLLPRDQWQADMLVFALSGRATVRLSRYYQGQLLSLSIEQQG